MVSAWHVLESDVWQLFSSLQLSHMVVCLVLASLAQELKMSLIVGRILVADGQTASGGVRLPWLGKVRNSSYRGSLLESPRTMGFPQMHFHSQLLPLNAINGEHTLNYSWSGSNPLASETLGSSPGLLLQRISLRWQPGFLNEILSQVDAKNLSVQNLLTWKSSNICKLAKHA